MINLLIIILCFISICQSCNKIISIIFANNSHHHHQHHPSISFTLMLLIRMTTIIETRSSIIITISFTMTLSIRTFLYLTHYSFQIMSLFIIQIFPIKIYYTPLSSLLLFLTILDLSKILFKKIINIIFIIFLLN